MESMNENKFKINNAGKELLQAWFNAKSELKSTILPEGKNPHFNSDYIQLDALVKKIDPVSRNHGLGIIMFPTGTGLITILFHNETSQFIQSHYELVLDRQTAQGVGSALTYAKRQILQAMFGLSAGPEEDDDGVAAENMSQNTGINMSDNIISTTKYAIQNMSEMQELNLYFKTMPEAHQKDDRIVELFRNKKAELSMLQM